MEESEDMFNPFKIWGQMTQDMLESYPGSLSIAFLVGGLAVCIDTYQQNNLTGYILVLLCLVG